MVLGKLKRLLGLDSGDDDGRSERDVTVQEREETDAENGATVEGGEDDPAAADTDAEASTESLVDEEIAQEEAAGRAEPAEAAGPEAADETTDIDEAGADVEAEGDGDSPSVDEVKGIGPAYSERLAEIGIVTVADLRDADAEAVAERTTAPEKTVRKWIDRANERA